MAVETLLPQMPQQDSGVKMGDRTWRLDLERGRLGGEITGQEAVKQAILVALSVPRYQHLIFSDNFGEELTGLLGRDFDYLCAAAPELIRDALRVDERISDVKDFSFTEILGGAEIRFTAVSESGEVQTGITL